MAVIPTLAEVKAITLDDAFIQAIPDENDPTWVRVVEYVDRTVKDNPYGVLKPDAQLFLIAHFLSMANVPIGGRGPLSSDSVGGVSQSFTLPWLNRTTVLGGTQFGIMHLEIRNQVVAAFRVIRI